MARASRPIFATSFGEPVTATIIVMKKKRSSPPTWDAIRRFVEGQLRADRQRHDGRLKDAIALERRSREKELAALGDQIELVAVTLLRHLDDNR